MPERPSRPLTTLTVTATRPVSPALTRVELRSDDLSAFAGSEHTDRYAKLRLTTPGGDPVVRTYTVLDPVVEADGSGTLAIEFVVHGDEGYAGPWAAAAQPGDELVVSGPGGAFAPDPSADWHLLVGDEAAVPAIRAALAALPADAVVAAYVEVEGPDHEIELPTTSATTLTWVHRGSPAQASMNAASGAAPPLLTAVLEQEWLPGRVQCFVHGEAQVVMHGIRPYLLEEHGLPRADVSISGYWRRGRTEEGFREWKSELAQAETVQPEGGA